MKTILAAALIATLAAPTVHALDGKWTPSQVLDIDRAWLAEQGLEISPQRLWDAERGTGLLTGAVNIGGCSGAFVSATGLIVTNHHCLFSLVQQHSAPERDLITQGYLARTRADELPGSTLRVTVPRRFTDVTAALLAAVPADTKADARLDAIDAAAKQLVERCEQPPGTKCEVAVFDDGVTYTLIEKTELRDVRLVWAPPRAIGEYGGEIDNWSWPRHTGDVAIARAYVGADNAPADHAADNVPYRPEFFFPIATDGIDPGQFVMVLGYPGITYRSLLAEEMRERRERFFVRRADLFGEWIQIIERSTADDAAGRIALASNLKGIANRHKNALGQIEGLDRGRIVERQQAQDEAVAAFAATQPEHADALAARAALRQLMAEGEQTWERDFLLNLIALGIESVPGSIPPLPKGLYYGATLAQVARERTKPEVERAEGFAADDLPRIIERFDREQQNWHPATDRALLAALVARALALPEGQRLPSIERRFRDLDAAAIEARIAALYADTRLFDSAARKDLLAATEANLASRNDALLSFGLDWNSDLRAAREQQRARAAQTALHRPAWRRAVAAHAGRPVAPDANGTLRVSFGHVQGYSPRDGVQYLPFTTLSGLLAKHSGKDPFAAPASLRSAATGPADRWFDSQLGDLAVNFLADGDTSGGNSGSPVINGRGELVGVNFDRVWENVANDFGFNPAVARNISVDARYLLWLLERVDGAKALLTELGVQAEVSESASR